MSLGISYAGFRSGFPFPIRNRTDEAYGTGTDYPIGFTMNQLTEFFWRAKFLELDFELESEVEDEFIITASSVGLDYNQIKKQFLNSEIPESGPFANTSEWKDVDDELHLITAFKDDVVASDGVLGSCVFINNAFNDNSLSEPVVGSWSRNPAFGEPSSGLVTFYEFQMNVRFWDVISITEDGIKLFYPRLLVYVILASDFTINPTTAVIATNIFEEGTPTIPLTICGATAQVPVYRGAPTPSSPSLSASGSITIEPTEYFTYGGKFNATTGARV